MSDSLRQTIRAYLQEGAGVPTLPPNGRFIPGPIGQLHVHGTRQERAKVFGAFCRPWAESLQNQVVQQGLHALSQQYPQIKHLPPTSTAKVLSRLFFWPGLPKDFKQEIRTFCRVADLSPYVAGLLMLSSELEMMGCSTASIDGPHSGNGPIFGRNLDFNGFNILDVASLLTVHHSSEADEIPSAWFGWLSVWGVFTGWNRAGLSLGCMVIYNARPQDRPMLFPVLRGVPMAWAYTQILRQCATVSQAVDYLKRTQPTAPNNLMLVDSGGEAVMAEWAPTGLVVRSSENGCLFGTNGFRSTEMAGKPDDCWRYDDMHRFLNRQPSGQFTASSMKSLLGKVNQGETTLQSAVFEPVAGRVHLAAGSLPSTLGPWSTLPWDVWSAAD